MDQRDSAFSLRRPARCPKRPNDWLNLGAHQESQSQGGGNDRSQLPKTSSDLADVLVGGGPDDQVDEQDADDRRDRKRNERQRKYGSRGEYRKGDVPPVRLDRLGSPHPPQVVALRILKPRQCPSRTLLRGAIGAHQIDQGFERREDVTGVRGPQAMVERVLAQRTDRSIDLREDHIEIEISPGAIVEGRLLGRSRQPRTMRFGETVETMHLHSQPDSGD